MPWWLAVLASISALASAGFGIVAVVRPGSAAAPGSDAVPSRFYPAMYAGRAVPLGLAVCLVVWIAPVAPVTPVLLGVATLAQLSDLVLGVAHRLPGMVAGAAFAAACQGAAIVALV